MKLIRDKFNIIVILDMARAKRNIFYTLLTTFYIVSIALAFSLSSMPQFSCIVSM